jgi:hypothetical protein
VRRLILTVTVLFITGLAALTVVDIANNGPSPLDFVAILILVFFWIGIVGALRNPPPQ